VLEVIAQPICEFRKKTVIILESNPLGASRLAKSLETRSTLSPVIEYYYCLSKRKHISSILVPEFVTNSKLALEKITVMYGILTIKERAKYLNIITP